MWPQAADKPPVIPFLLRYRMFVNPNNRASVTVRPTLQSTNGLRKSWIARGASTLVLAAIAWGLGQPSQAAAANTVVEAVQLPAWVERQGQRRPAQPGQLLRDSDKAVTADGARMLLRLPDRSVIKLGEQTQFQIEAMVAKQQSAAGPSEIKSSLRLITGVFR
jgi:hypothetical protein